MNIDSAPTTASSFWEKHSTGENSPIHLTTRERNYLKWLITKLADWEPRHNATTRVKRLVDILAVVGTAIGPFINAGQIKKIKQNIAILQDTAETEN